MKNSSDCGCRYPVETGLICLISNHDFVVNFKYLNPLLVKLGWRFFLMNFRVVKPVSRFSFHQTIVSDFNLFHFEQYLDFALKCSNNLSEKSPLCSRTGFRARKPVLTFFYRMIFKSFNLNDNHCGTFKHLNT